MTLVRNAKAKWLPSRHRYALARLVAFVILSRKGDDGSPPTDAIYANDRDQSALENYAISIWVTATLTCYLAPYVTWWLALPAALMAIQLPIYICGLIAGSRRVTSVVLWILLATASAWGGWVGWFFYAVLGANAIAYVVLFALRHRVRALEQRCVV